MSEPHLSPSELTAWRDHGTGDRDRIFTHLAACSGCRHVAAELERERPPESDARPARFDVNDFVSAGLQATAPRQRWLTGPVRVALLAAAASLVLATFVVPAWFREPSTTTVRGAAGVVTLQNPVDLAVAADSLTFEWTARADAGSLRLYVVALDDPGTPLIERDVAGTRYEPAPDERRRLQPGREYHWFLEYQGAGAGAGTSGSARFRVR
jgi:hypothetical protein